MKSTFKTAMFASVAGLGLSLAACDSAADNAAEEDAAAVEQAADAEADTLEAEADMLDDQGLEAEADAMEEQADTIEDQGEATADAMEGAAE